MQRGEAPHILLLFRLLMSMAGQAMTPAWTVGRSGHHARDQGSRMIAAAGSPCNQPNGQRGRIKERRDLYGFCLDSGA